MQNNKVCAWAGNDRVCAPIGIAKFDEHRVGVEFFNHGSNLPARQRLLRHVY